MSRQLREVVFVDGVRTPFGKAGAKGMFKPEADYDFFEGMSEFDRAEWPKMHFIEQRYADDPTNWWAPNRAASAAMLMGASHSGARAPATAAAASRAERGENSGRITGASPASACAAAAVRGSAVWS